MAVVIHMNWNHQHHEVLQLARIDWGVLDFSTWVMANPREYTTS
jgi:hypothetical protein